RPHEPPLRGRRGGGPGGGRHRDRPLGGGRGQLDLVRGGLGAGSGGREALGGEARGALRTRTGSRRALGLRRPRENGRGEEEGGDRKSTRLNSSHEWTSYAVFCLKEKTWSGRR